MKKGTQRVMNTQSDSQNEFSRVRDIIRKIEDKSASGDYIYRGEPEHYEESPYYGKVSSTLYRHYKATWAMGFDLNVEEFQTQILNEAREYTHETASDFEILAELQHYEGKTNLIDFTTDYLIALFFACDGSPGNNGRVILQERNEIKGLVEKPREPSKPINRVITQKSIFVRPLRGFIEPNSEDVVDIWADLKISMLDYLRKYHNISAKTIYNDLHGFIRKQRIHHSAYEEFYNALICGKQREDRKAIEHYTKALELNPQMDSAYYNRGLAYADIGEFDKAIEDYSTIINQNSGDAGAYSSRGEAYLCKGEYDKAIKDYSETIELKPDYAFFYLNRGKAWLHVQKWDKAIKDLTDAWNIGRVPISVADFAQLPEAIATMLIQRLPEDLAVVLRQQ